MWLEILVDDYVVNFDGETCAFCVTNSGDPWLTILGDSLMRNFYVIHDMETMEMGFAPMANVETVKVAPVYGSVPSCGYEETCAEITSDTEGAFVLPEWVIPVAIALALLAVGFAIIWYFLCRSPSEVPDSEAIVNNPKPVQPDTEEEEQTSSVIVTPDKPSDEVQEPTTTDTTTTQPTEDTSTTADTSTPV